VTCQGNSINENEVDFQFEDPDNNFGSRTPVLIIYVHQLYSTMCFSMYFTSFRSINRYLDCTCRYVNVNEIKKKTCHAFESFSKSEARKVLRASENNFIFPPCFGGILRS